MDKRDSLMEEFHSLIRDAREARKELNENLQIAARSLLLAQAIERESAVRAQIARRRVR